MADDLYRRRAQSFGARAAAYAEHRPDYPADGIRWALGGATREVRQVLDLAAGTGKLTEGLLPLGLEVTAVEPDDEMRTELARRFPAARALAGSAEEIPLPDASMDAVLVGQAFHWFDPETAPVEIARVLRPGGVVGALWNVEDNAVDWVADMGPLARSSIGDAAKVTYAFPPHPSFGELETAVFPHVHRRTAESMAETIGTHSHTLVVTEAERAAILARVSDYLRARHGSAEFDYPLVTTVVRTPRS
jgi:SAM-dependent methyltransferase